MFRQNSKAELQIFFMDKPIPECNEKKSIMIEKATTTKKYLYFNQQQNYRKKSSEKNLKKKLHLKKQNKQTEIKFKIKIK